MRCLGAHTRLGQFKEFLPPGKQLQNKELSMQYTNTTGLDECVGRLQRRLYLIYPLDSIGCEYSRFFLLIAATNISLGGRSYLSATEIRYWRMT